MDLGQRFRLYCNISDQRRLGWTHIPYRSVSFVLFRLIVLEKVRLPGLPRMIFLRGFTFQYNVA